MGMAKDREGEMDRREHQCRFLPGFFIENLKKSPSAQWRRQKKHGGVGENDVILPVS